MSVSVDINDAGQAVLLIADADGECRSYRFRLVPPGYSLWALEVTRSDTDAAYRIAEESPGRWSCTCPVETYRKRGSDHCKHIAAGRAFRAFLRSLEKVHVERHPTKIA